MLIDCIKDLKGTLTEDEWRELVTLEYCLTWGYTHDEPRDEKRMLELRDKMNQNKEVQS